VRTDTECADKKICVAKKIKVVNEFEADINKSAQYGRKYKRDNLVVSDG
jgi:hypothetical protein